MRIVSIDQNQLDTRRINILHKESTTSRYEQEILWWLRTHWAAHSLNGRANFQRWKPVVPVPAEQNLCFVFCLPMASLTSVLIIVQALGMVFVAAVLGAAAWKATEAAML